MSSADAAADGETMAAVAAALARVRSSMRTAAAKFHRPEPRLVAVSKTKPAAAVAEAYAAGQRHFGENYVQELVEKAPLCPPDVRWHFIGQLQSNKAKPLLASVPGLWAVESVDSVKLANLLNKAKADLTAAATAAGTAASAAASPSPRHLRVYVQVNTSGEEQKGGTQPGADTIALAKYIMEHCPALRLVGLMTIGKYDESARVFFDRLVDQRAAVEAAIGHEALATYLGEYAPPVPPPMTTAAAGDGEGAAAAGGVQDQDSVPVPVPPAAAGGGAAAAAAPPHTPLLELSMGMSADYELAVECGSTNVRVGSTIFGAREYAGSKPPTAAPAAPPAAAADPAPSTGGAGTA